MEEKIKRSFGAASLPREDLAIGRTVKGRFQVRLSRKQLTVVFMSQMRFRRGMRKYRSERVCVKTSD
ncbi:MAG: hypothetical protein DWH94_08160 [Planctomycetota bacterium]|nr:MAG: hypothetical protein DWH80_09880 [Planctomycetota bacterium]RLS56613.1 MAG: hypothetical protein DWH94_08160 [Planctomycetota bacterium]